MSEAVSNSNMRPRISLPGVLFEFLGSMNLAITLLMVVAIASIIGMVVQQNQPYSDYLLQFGPLWFQVFRDLGLYSVYSSSWFVAILAFLVVSTSVCIVRTGPGMLREMGRFRLSVQAKSLRLMRQHAELETTVAPGAVSARAERLLRNHGYRVRATGKGDAVTLAGMKGASNRLGYLLTHIGLVVILLSGVIDGNLPLQILMALHGLRIETQDIPASQVPPSSRLAPGTLAFRGNVSIPVGDTTHIVFLKMGKGYLVQQLPFSLTLKKFTVQRFMSGPPKDFVSRVVLRDPTTGQTVRATVSDNHPLMFHGYDIYQTSFSDGGSHLRFRLWRFGNGRSRAMHGSVFNHYPVHTAQGVRIVELEGFRRFNVIGARIGQPGSARGRGPSFTYKIRKPDGVAREYINYELPQHLHGRLYYLSGVRSSPAQNYHFLRIPAGPHGGVRRFMQLVSALHDPAQRQDAVKATATEAEQALGGHAQQALQRLDASLGHLLQLFATGGYNAVLEEISRHVPRAHQPAVANASLQVIGLAVANLYRGVLQRDGIAGFGTTQQAWLRAALPTLGVISLYGSPFYLQLTGFTQVQASGLQITHYPATLVAFIGSAMLMVGIFLMFFVAHRRIWVRLDKRESGGTSILFAGTTNRHRREFARQFAELEDKLFARLRN